MTRSAREKRYGVLSVDQQRTMSGLECDSCKGLAVHSMLDKGFGQTTLGFKISLLRPVTPETGPVRAEGRVISRGRRIGTAEGRLADAEGRLLAHGTTTCLIFEHQSG